MFNDLGLPVIIVSNQPGIAKGHFEAALIPELEGLLNMALQSAGAHIDGTYYCLHHPDALVANLRRRCTCRKPGIGMLTRAAHDLNLTLRDSYMLGDGLTDIEAGSRAGCRTIFVGRWKCEHCQFIRPRALRPAFVAKNLIEAARLIQQDFLPNTRATSRQCLEHAFQSCC
jgi:histidinol-phosphate phosphatase family protein